MNLVKIFQLFPTQESCVKYLEKICWNNKPYCPYCKSIKNHPYKDGLRYFCNSCSRSFSVTVNTIMHDIRILLQKWFLAVSLIANAKKGISSRQVARDLDLSVKTAYSVSQRIRKAMLGTPSPLLQGIIEIDETYIGGKPRIKGISKKGRGTKKVIVVGAVQRDGSVYARQFEKFTTKDVRNFILENVDINKSEIHTDEYRVYNKVGKILTHKQVNHGQKEYSRNGAHTNSIEGFWSLVKRGYYGQYHHYSKKYINLYIAEASFKYNLRKENQETVFENIFGGLLHA